MDPAKEAYAATIAVLGVKRDAWLAAADAYEKAKEAVREARLVYLELAEDPSATLEWDALTFDASRGWQVWAGANLYSVPAELCILANREKRTMTVKFNAVPMTANPGDTSAGVLARYDLLRLGEPKNS